MLRLIMGDITHGFESGEWDWPLGRRKKYLSGSTSTNEAQPQRCAGLRKMMIISKQQKLSKGEKSSVKKRLKEKSFVEDRDLRICMLGALSELKQVIQNNSIGKNMSQKTLSRPHGGGKKTNKDL